MAELELSLRSDHIEAFDVNIISTRRRTQVHSQKHAHAHTHAHVYVHALHRAQPSYVPHLPGSTPASFCAVHSLPPAPAPPPVLVMSVRTASRDHYRHQPHLPGVLSLNLLLCGPLFALLSLPQADWSERVRSPMVICSTWSLSCLGNSSATSKSPSSSLDLPSSEPPLRPHACPPSPALSPKMPRYRLFKNFSMRVVGSTFNIVVAI